MKRFFSQLVKTQALFAVMAVLFSTAGIAQSQTLDELHKSALKEGGTLEGRRSFARTETNQGWGQSRDSCRAARPLG